LQITVKKLEKFYSLTSTIEIFRRLTTSTVDIIFGGLDKTTSFESIARLHVWLHADASTNTLHPSVLWHCWLGHV